MKPYEMKDGRWIDLDQIVHISNVTANHQYVDPFMFTVSCFFGVHITVSNESEEEVIACRSDLIEKWKQR